MGGYGFYVWGSYLATAACIAGEVLFLRARRREARRHVRAESARNETPA
jgi:heme exporter protein D